MGRRCPFYRMNFSRTKTVKTKGKDVTFLFLLIEFLFLASENWAWNRLTSPRTFHPFMLLNLIQILILIPLSISIYRKTLTSNLAQRQWPLEYLIILWPSMLLDSQNLIIDVLSQGYFQIQRSHLLIIFNQSLPFNLLFILSLKFPQPIIQGVVFLFHNLVLRSQILVFMTKSLPINFIQSFQLILLLFKSNI